MTWHSEWHKSAGGSTTRIEREQRAQRLSVERHSKSPAHTPIIEGRAAGIEPGEAGRKNGQAVIVFYIPLASSF